MPFLNGSVAYARYRVLGGPDAPDEAMLERFATNVLRPPSFGVPPEVDAGWSGPRHVLDEEFAPERVVVGDAVTVGMRIDVCRVPAELRRAFRAQAERGAAGGHAARMAREEAEERCREELAAGRHRTSKLVPVLWLVSRRLLLAPAASEAAESCLRDLLDRSFGVRLERLSAGRMAFERLAARGGIATLEDLRPSAFGPPPAQGASAEAALTPQPGVPWAMAAGEPHDFLGAEFLLWLWSHLERDSGAVETGAGPVEITIERLLDLQCAWGAAGRATLAADAPARLAEARAAVRAGKWPRRAGLLLAADGDHWGLTLQGDRMLISGAKLPRPEEELRDAREMAEWRIGQIERLDAVLEAIFNAFLDVRTTARWTSEREAIVAWARGGAAGGIRPAPPVEIEVRTEPPLVEA